MKRTATLFFSFALVTIGAASAFGQKRVLENTAWRLIEANGVRVSRSDAEIIFDNAVRGFTGNTGCNSMSGTVDIRGRNIDFGPVRTTRRACKLAAGNVAESVVLRALENARTFDVRNDNLRLYDRRGRVLLRFARAPRQDNLGDNVAARLDDRKWVLEQIKGRQTFVALPYAFINFDSQKMSAGGDTSCNVFGGQYSVTGDQIRIRQVVSTMRACVEDNAKMSTERDMLDGLRTANRFEIKNQRLYLYRGRDILLTFRGERK